MINIFLFLSIILAITLTCGLWLEKIRIPWVFAALFFGMFLSLDNPFPDISHSDAFYFLSDLGMYFLLFMIGLEIDLREIRKQGLFIGRLSLSLVFAESLIGSIFIHYVFGVDWGPAILTASSFATVGEAILIPILDEFGLIKTKFGQILLGVGTFDDIVELVTIVAASIVLGHTVGHSGMSMGNTFFYLALLFVIPLLLEVFQSRIPHLKFKQVPSLFLFGLLILFAFVGIGSLTESAALGAIFAGIALRTFLSEEKIAEFESIVKAVAYGFLVPIFFLRVGLEVDLHYVVKAPLMILYVLLITNTTKIGLSYLMGRSVLGTKKSVLLGIGLSAKFSTSIVIITMLYNQNIIPSQLYSVLIGAMVASKFIIPVSFALLIEKWTPTFKKAR